MFIRRKTFKNAANSRAKSSWFIYTYEFFGVKNIKRMDKKSYYSIFLVFLNLSKYVLLDNKFLPSSLEIINV